MNSFFRAEQGEPSVDKLRLKEQFMKNRVVVITGATGKLGQIAARAFAERGASLALLSTNQDKLDSLAQNLNLPSDRILTQVVNLLYANAVRETAEAITAKFGRVDVLIHLIGGWVGGKTIAETDVDDFKFMLDQHAWTTVHLLRAFSPKLAANGWGRVIAVSSPSATNPPAKSGAYAVGKAAQETLILTLADEFKGTDLTANVIQVSYIDVEGKGKGTSPEEIVSAMLYLCSDEAGKVNGTRLPLF
jgi:NAD(P)-dependent dehydrogenase (short-subunit alcohol dehydrogenase family)